MISLILGDTNFPDLVIKNLKKKKINFFIIDLSKNNKFKNEKNSFRFSLGKFGSMIDLIKKKILKKFYLPVKLINQNFPH